MTSRREVGSKPSQTDQSAELPEYPAIRFMGGIHALSDATQARLIELLGPPSDQPGENQKTLSAIDQVERWVGSYKQFEKYFNRAPRASDYAGEFASLLSEAHKFLQRVWSLSNSPWYHEELRLQLQSQADGPDVYMVESALVALVGASDAIAKKYAGHPSKGAPTNFALFGVLKNLRYVFHQNYRGPSAPRRKRGAVQYRNAKEQCEIEFLRVALRDANILAKHEKSRIHRLLKDPRCSHLEANNGTATTE